MEEILGRFRFSLDSYNLPCLHVLEHMDFHLPPSRMEDNPLIWMLNVNGFMMDVRKAPREVQQIAFEKELIPYIPADRP